MERKSFDLYAQSIVWCGGLATAALGGVLVALFEAKNPSAVIWLRILVVPLISVVVCAGYCQFHVTRVLNLKEQEDERRAAGAQGVVAAAPAATASAAGAGGKTLREIAARSLAFWQSGMLLSMGVSLLALLLAVWLYRVPAETPSWTVAKVEGGASDALIVMSKPGTTDLRILTRESSGAEWRVQTVSTEDPGPTAATQDGKP